jgi:hypothetical protein
MHTRRRVRPNIASKFYSWSFSTQSARSCHCDASRPRSLHRLQSGRSRSLRTLRTSTYAWRVACGQAGWRADCFRHTKVRIRLAQPTSHGTPSVVGAIPQKLAVQRVFGMKDRTGDGGAAPIAQRQANRLRWPFDGSEWGLGLARASRSDFFRGVHSIGIQADQARDR